MHRHPARLLLLVAAGLTAATACTEDFPRLPTTPRPGAPPLTAPQSFNVQGTLQLVLPNGEIPHDVPPSNPEAFVLRVDPAGATMIMGAFRTAIAVPLNSQDGIVFHATKPVGFPVQGGMCGSSASYTDFHFTASPDSISGVAGGM